MTALIALALAPLTGVESQILFLEQTVEHAPGQGAEEPPPCKASDRRGRSRARLAVLGAGFAAGTGSRAADGASPPATSQNGRDERAQGAFELLNIVHCSIIWGALLRRKIVPSEISRNLCSKTASSPQFTRFHARN